MSNTFNHTRRLFAAGLVSLDDLKVMLLGSGASFNAANTNISSLVANEVSGGGWASGGELLTSVQIETTATSAAVLTADDIEVTAESGGIGPAFSMVVYDSDSGNVLFHYPFGGERSSPNGDPFIVRFPSGIHLWRAPS